MKEINSVVLKSVVFHLVEKEEVIVEKRNKTKKKVLILYFIYIL